MRILSALWLAAAATCLGLRTAPLSAQEVPRIRIHVAPSIDVPLGAWRADYGNSAKVRVTTGAPPWSGSKDAEAAPPWATAADFG